MTPVQTEVTIALAGKVAERRALQGSQAGWVRQRERRDLDSFHEAGHAIAAKALGKTVYMMTVVPDGRDRGQCFYGNGSRPGMDVSRMRSLGDAEYCAGAVDDPSELVPLTEKASGILEKHWSVVCDLVELLEMRGTLDQAAIAGVFRAHAELSV